MTGKPFFIYVTLGTSRLNVSSPLFRRVSERKLTPVFVVVVLRKHKA